MLYILILKCLDRVLASATSRDDIKCFEILVEVYKFFKLHPPENLIEGISKNELKFILN